MSRPEGGCPVNHGAAATIKKAASEAQVCPVPHGGDVRSRGTVYNVYAQVRTLGQRAGVSVLSSPTQRPGV